MALKRSEKEEVVKTIAERFQKAAGVVVAEYSGLKVSQMNELRREIKKVEGDFRVLKNRLTKIALGQIALTKLGLGGEEAKVLAAYFKGPVGVAFSGADPVALVKAVSKCRETWEALKLKGGVLGGKLLSVKEIQQISKLPSKEELYAKLLGTLQAPVRGLLRTLQGVPQKLVMALNGIKDKK